MIKPAILGATQEIWNAVTPEIHHRGADIVPLDVPGGQRAVALEPPKAVLAAEALVKIRVGSIEQQVGNSVAVSIRQAELAPAAAARGAIGEPERLA
jgi:hypothetical protein